VGVKGWEKKIAFEEDGLLAIGYWLLAISHIALHCMYTPVAVKI
jgi:hypothetical protein